MDEQHRSSGGGGKKSKGPYSHCTWTVLGFQNGTPDGGWALQNKKTKDKRREGGGGKDLPFVVEKRAPWRKASKALGRRRGPCRHWFSEEKWFSKGKRGGAAVKQGNSETLPRGEAHNPSGKKHGGQGMSGDNAKEAELNRRDIRKTGNLEWNSRITRTWNPPAHKGIKNP